MGTRAIEKNENVYFRARKNAAEYNERLWSREGAAELLGVSVSTLADYELGITKIVPVDKVVLMADLYRCPELKNMYCRCECPIGQKLPFATEASSLEGVALRMIIEFENIKQLQSDFVKIAADGKIDDEEREQLKLLKSKVDNLFKVISELQLICEKEIG